jgi:hypothetical protein
VPSESVKIAWSMFPVGQPATAGPPMSRPRSVHGPVGVSAVSRATPPFESEYVRWYRPSMYRMSGAHGRVPAAQYDGSSAPAG